MNTATININRFRGRTSDFSNYLKNSGYTVYITKDSPSYLNEKSLCNINLLHDEFNTFLKTVSTPSVNVAEAFELIFRDCKEYYNSDVLAEYIAEEYKISIMEAFTAIKKAGFFV